MSDWVVIPCLKVLIGEFNQVSPHRDKGADGTIGDTAHSPGSDHTPDEDSRVLRDHDADNKNEVHACDIDSTGPWPDGKRGDIAGSWFDKKIKEIIATEKKRWLDPKDMCRLNYIIWRGMIYDKDNDWAGKTYNGSDKHINHCHFSGRYETRAENDTRSWGVYVPPQPAEDDLPVDQATFNKLMTGWAKTPEGAQALLTGLMGAQYGSKVYPTRKLGDFVRDLHGERDFRIGDAAGKDPEFSKVTPESPLGQMAGVPAQVTALDAKVSALPTT